MTEPITTHEWQLIVILLNGKTTVLKTWTRKPEPADVTEYIAMIKSKGLRVDVPMALINHVATTRTTLVDFLGGYKLPEKKALEPNPNPVLNVANAGLGCPACNFPSYEKYTPCPECGWVEQPPEPPPALIPSAGTESCIACALESINDPRAFEMKHTCGKDKNGTSE